MRCSSSPDDAAIDVTQLPVHSATYALVGVTDSGHLEVAVEEKTGEQSTDQVRLKHVQIKLLGAEIQHSQEAVALLRSSLASANEIELRFDRRRVSDDSRELLAYAFHGQTCLNVELVRQGLASNATHPSDAGPMIRQIKKAEQEAKREQRGIWSN